MIEVVVSMTIMSIFMAIFSGSLYQIFRGLNTSESIATAQGQSGVLFARLDREVRFASTVGDPEPIGPVWYVEYRTIVDDPATPRCVSLRYIVVGGEGQLQRNEWVAGTAMATGAWSVLASKVTLTGASPPFVIPALGTDILRRLTVNVTINYGGGGTDSRTEFRVTFTALNSVAQATAGTNECTLARRSAV
jgi:hypothetical protein